MLKIKMKSVVFWLFYSGLEVSVYYRVSLI